MNAKTSRKYAIESSYNRAIDRIKKKTEEGKISAIIKNNDISENEEIIAAVVVRLNNDGYNVNSLKHFVTIKW